MDHHCLTHYNDQCHVKISCEDAPVVNGVIPEVRCSNVSPQTYQPYVCRLDPAAVHKAREELREFPDERDAKILELCQWIENNDEIECRTDPEFLLRFLRVAKFQVPMAKERIRKFCTVRSSPVEGVADWFSNDRLDPIARQVLESGFFLPLPKRDSKGRRVILIKADRLNFGLHGPEAVLRGGLLAADQIISESEADNIHGYVLLHDMSNVGFEHVLPWNRNTIKKCIKCCQDVYPFRLKEYNIMTSSPIISTLLNFAKRLLKEKYRKRIFAYSDLESLYNTVPPAILPEEYGGSEAPISVLIDRLGQSINANVREFELLKLCRIKTPPDQLSLVPRTRDRVSLASHTGLDLLNEPEIPRLGRSESAPAISQEIDSDLI